MIAHLFEKFKLELDNLLKWLLKFACRLPGWNQTKPYELHKLGMYSFELSTEPLMEIEVTVEAAREIIEQFPDDSDNVSPKANSGSGNVVSGFTLKKKVPFKQRLKSLKPKKARHAIETTPMLEQVYFRFFKWVNHFCAQFNSVKRIEAILYKRIKFTKADKFLNVSPASKEKDAQVMYDERGLPSVSEDAAAETPTMSYPATPKQMLESDYDEIFRTRERVEFVIKDQMETVEEQVIKLKHFIRYFGLSYDDVIFELKRMIFENNLDTQFSDDEGSIDAERVDPDAIAVVRKDRPSSAEQIEKLRKQVMEQEVTEA